MPPLNRGEFFVGYEAHAPPGIARWIRRSAIAAFGLSALLAAGLVVAQHRFDPASFAFQDFREYNGILVSRPAPILHGPNGSFLLAGQGKHGLDALPAHTANTVTLRGALAENGPDRLLEVVPGSLRMTGAGDAPPVERFGTHAFHGEIVDTKCYAGVMNPGRGKVHRACAARCLSGGIPAGLLVRDSAGRPRVFVLTGAGAAREQCARIAGEPVSVRGEVSRQGSIWILDVAPGAIRRE